MRRRSVLILAAFCAVLLIPGAASAKKKRAKLFNGKNLKGWTVLRCEAEVIDGEIHIESGNGLIQTEEMYGDFVLEFDWKALKDDKWDSGVYFRYQSVPPLKPWPKEHQVNLRKGLEGNVSTVEGASSTGLIKERDWNTFKLTVKGSSIALEINGEKAWAADGMNAPDEGYISLQAEVPGGGKHRFKNIYITELKAQK